MRVAHHYRRQRYARGEDFTLDVPLLVVRVFCQTVLPWNFCCSGPSELCTECSSFAGAFRKTIEEIDFSKHVVPSAFFAWHRGVAICCIGSTASACKAIDLENGFGCAIH